MVPLLNADGPGAHQFTCRGAAAPSMTFGRCCSAPQHVQSQSSLARPRLVSNAAATGHSIFFSTATSSHLQGHHQGPHMVLAAPAGTAASTLEQQHSLQRQQWQQQQQERSWQQPSTAWHTGLPGAATERTRQQQQQKQHFQGDPHQPGTPQESGAQQHQSAHSTAPVAGNGKHAASPDAAKVQQAEPSSSSARRSPGSSSSRSSVQERIISSCIKQCSSWQQVDAVVREYGPAFNIIHISAAITHLAQLSQRPAAPIQQQQQQLPADNEQQVLGLRLITSQMERQHNQLQQQLAGSRQQQQQQRGVQPGSASPPQAARSGQQQQELVGRLLQQAVAKLQHASSRQVANILWAVSVLQVPSSSSYSSSSSNGYFSAAAGSIELIAARAAALFGSAEAQHLSNIALAVAKLQLPVSQEWLHQLLAAWLQLVRQHQQGVVGSSDGRYTVVRAGRISSRVVSSSNGSNSSSIGQPDQVQTMQHAGSQPSVSAAAAAVGSSSAAEQAAGSSSRARRSGPATGPPLISPQASCNLLWALVQLQQQPPQGWLQEVVGTATPQLASWPLKSVAMFMWACGRLGYSIQCTTPPQVAVGVSAVQHQGGSAAGVAALHSSSQHGYHPAAVAAGVLAALQQHAAAFSSRDLSQALWAAAVMGLQVPDSCLQLLLTAGVHHQLRQLQQQPHNQPGLHQGQASSTAAAAAAGQGSPSHVPGQQQAGQQARGDVCHSVSVLLWSVSRLVQGSQQRLPAGVLQPWMSALSAHAAAAPSQSLGVAAWGAVQLGLTPTCQQLLLQLLQAAAHKQQGATLAQHQQQHQRNFSSSRYTISAPAGQGLDGASAAAVLWAAARCIMHAQQQQHRQQAAVPGPSTGPHQKRQQQQQQVRQHAWGSSGITGGRQAVALTTAARQAAAAPAHKPHQAGWTRGLHQGVKAAATTLALHLTAPTQPQQQPLQAGVVPAAVTVLSAWQLALMLWSCSVMQLQFPAQWWQERLAYLLAVLQQQQQQHQQGQPAVEHCRESAQALAVSVWALGRARVRVPAAQVQQLQAASLEYLEQQQQQQQVLSQQGLVLLLLGFTRLATAAAAQLPPKSPEQRAREQKKYRLLRQKLQLRTRPGRKKRQQQQQQQQWQPTLQQQSCAAGALSASNPSSGSSGGSSRHSARKACHRRQQLQSPDVGWAARRHAWWRRHLQQQRACAVMRRHIWQRQRHGWVAATGLRASWLQSYCAACGPLVQDMGRDSLVAVLWALGRLRFHPGRAFMAAAQQRVGQLLPGMGPRHISLLLWSLARLGSMPERQLMDALMHAWEMQLAYAGKADMQQAGWAHRQLQLQMQRTVQMRQQQPQAS